MVIKVGNLQEFMQEAQLSSDVRLSQHEVITYRNPLTDVELCLDLMGFNEGDELIWLHYVIQLQLTPGTREPWTEHGKAIYEAFPGLVDLVRDYLTQRYIVRPGLYGIAQDIAPLNGSLEIARWDKDARKFKLVQTDALAERRLQEAQVL